MKVKVVTERWAYKEVDGVKKIIGIYKVQCGGTQIAKQEFNDGYNSTTIIFPTELLLEIEALSRKIEKAITENFTGEEA